VIAAYIKSMAKIKPVGSGPLYVGIQIRRSDFDANTDVLRRFMHFTLKVAKASQLCACVPDTPIYERALLARHTIRDKPEFESAH
jgi:hypothetical protein